MNHNMPLQLFRHIHIFLLFALILSVHVPYQLLAQQSSVDSELNQSSEVNTNASAITSSTDTTENSSNSFEFSGDYTSVVFAEDNERTILQGNAKIISKTTQLFSESIEVFGTDFRYANSIGNVVVIDNEQNYRLSAQELWFDREDEVLRARGQAVLEDYDNELVIKGEIIEFRNKEQLSEIQRGVRILGEDIVARSEYVRFNRDTEVVEFSGLPVVEWKEDEYSAARIILDMDDDTVELQGQVYGKIQVDNENEEDDSNDEEANLQQPVADDQTLTEGADASEDLIEAGNTESDSVQQGDDSGTETAPSNNGDALIDVPNSEVEVEQAPVLEQAPALEQTPALEQVPDTNTNTDPNRNETDTNTIDEDDIDNQPLLESADNIDNITPTVGNEKENKSVADGLENKDATKDIQDGTSDSAPANFQIAPPPNSHNNAQPPLLDEATTQ